MDSSSFTLTAGLENFSFSFCDLRSVSLDCEICISGLEQS